MPISETGRYHNDLVASRNMNFSTALMLALKGKFFKIAAFVTAVTFGYPLLLESTNYAIPKKAELIVFKGEVLEVRGRSPHITLKLQDQHVLKAEFPVQAFTKGHHDDTYLFYPIDRAKFQLCKKVAIRGQYFKYYPLDLLRIWEVECIDNSFRITYESVVNYWTAKRNYVLIPQIVGVLLSTFLFLLFLAQDARRLQREASNEVPLK